jgi:hypothetical protein
MADSTMSFRQKSHSVDYLKYETPSLQAAREEVLQSARIMIEAHTR